MAHWWWGVLPYECVILNFIVWTCVGRHARYNAKAERDASRPSKKSMGGVFEGKLLQESKCSVQNFCRFVCSEGENAMFWTERSCEQKVRNAKPEILEKNSASKLAMLPILEISVSGCSLYMVFAPKNGLCEKFAIASFPPDRRTLQIPCGLGRRAGRICRRSMLFIREKAQKPRV